MKKLFVGILMIMVIVMVVGITRVVSADSSAVKPIKESPVIQEVFDKDMVAYDRYQRQRIERRERNERIERRERRERNERHNRYRYRHPRPRGCFIDTMDGQSLLSWLLNK